MNKSEILDDKTFLDRLIDLAVAKPTLPTPHPYPSPAKLHRTKPVLREGECLVHVAYKIPSLGELKVELGERNVSDIFDGRPFQRHPSCADIDETPGERVMLLKGFAGEIRSGEAIREMVKQGYRPATHLELYAFQKVNPELRGAHFIIALGSSTMRVGSRCVPGVWRRLGRRILGSECFDCFDCGWNRGGLVLFVRK